MKDTATIYIDGFSCRRKNTRIDAVLRNDVWIIDITRFSKEERDENCFEVCIKRMKGTLTVKRIAFYKDMFADINHLFMTFYSSKKI